jgi:O-antigen/teichoic acid export membrane protein
MTNPATTSYRAQLVRGSAVLIIGRGAGLLAGLVVTMLLARILGPEGFGVYALAQSTVALLAVPTQLGLPILVIREAALAQEQRNWGLMRGVLLWSLRAVLMTSLVIGTTTFVVAHLWRGSSPPEFLPTLTLALAYLAVTSFATVLQGILQGLRQFALGLLPDMLFVPALFALCLALVRSLGRPVTAPMATGIFACCALLSLIAVSLFVWRKMPPQTWRAKPVMRGEAWLAAAWPLCLTLSLALVNSQLIAVLVGALSSTTDVGLYRIASTTANMAIVVGATLGGVVGPYITTFHERGDVKRLSRLATYSAWCGALPAIALLVTYVLAGDKLLGLAFGAKFVPALPALVILTVGQTFNAATGVVTTLLNMTGHERDALRGAALGATTSLVLCLALIPGFGVIGAAVASTFGIAAEKLFLVLRVRSRLNINSSIIPRSPA